MLNMIVDNVKIIASSVINEYSNSRMFPSVESDENITIVDKIIYGSINNLGGMMIETI